MKEQDYDFI